MIPVRENRTGARSTKAEHADFLASVEEEITAFVAHTSTRCTPRVESMADFATHLAAACAGGKRLRPVLVETAYRGFDGAEGRAPVLLGAAFELLHSALLIHDDVIDRDSLRRGQQNIRGAYRYQHSLQGADEATATHTGDAAAIVAGDVLLAGAVRLAGRAAALSPQPDLVSDCFEDAVIASAAGELEDVLLAARPAGSACPPQRVLDMESLKTAAYSFDAPLRSGALLAGASPVDAHSLGTVGRRFGVAYQVIDDLLGTFGDSARTGKPSDSDLLEGKMTVLTAFGTSQDASLAPLLDDVRHGRVQPAAARDALRELGADRHAYALAADLVEEGVQLAESLLPPGPLRRSVISIGQRMVEREA